MFANEAQAYDAESSTSIFIGTMLSIVTLSAAIWLTAGYMQRPKRRAERQRGEDIVATKILSKKIKKELAKPPKPSVIPGVAQHPFHDDTHEHVGTEVGKS